MKAAVLAVCASIVSLCAAQAQEVVRHPLPAEIRYPEGVAYDASAGVLYTAGAEDGAVLRMDPRTGQAEVISKPGALVPSGAPFPAMLGMKLDGQGRLWIGGGRTGRIFIINPRTGAVIANLETKAPGEGVINDGAITPTGAFFTDTFRPVLWRVDPASPRQPEAWLDLRNTPIAYGEGPNLNGIAATPDGRSLIVVQMNKGLLFHIDVASKQVTPIDLRGESVLGGDGLVLDGRTLYVVSQTQEEIATISLSEDLKSGEVKARFRDPGLAWPATAALAGDRLLVVNGQFNRRTTGDAQRPFTILSVPVARLQP